MRRSSCSSLSHVVDCAGVLLLVTGASGAGKSHVLSTDGWDEMRWDRLAVLVPDWGMVRVDTTVMTRDGVAEAVLQWCRGALAGEAPIVRLT